ncbi:putative acylesterase/phospholipase RssA, containd patatin domain [Cupriavidus necator]|uniref:Patatin-like phospholipase family protein n=1 Tax=Cupriavidus necator (strain ATCC 17699 / DSM 428 / KCTC 22496 / NCIMB 10442 / H16 / Stanier 337) TaxID=381666 RepID=Q0K116_CUPNH|nr:MULTISPECIES: patatin-like phospholipase family protein [Cupriavidus]EON16271.1 alpha-beta hydrolase family esterase [Cupriavidus sp. GA3-3]KUE90077.1 alpha/beta hydrolase [Cupriavidus necator]QCC04150.1 patatin-like phospholipase family protein [Cupriavidus necator H16]QQB78836.1 patatin-like phospholipase family protein [Cupriavidus necator]WKA43054.1 patatin-like phospholipase family protein [Cupriavidus necator]
MQPEPAQPKPVALALQGGGMHGAFTWGVLDRLLEDGRLAIEGVSATSAGAMNATVLAYGLLQGGSDGARLALHDFWEAIAHSAQRYNPFRWLPWFKSSHTLGLNHSPMYAMADIALRLLSPYQFNPNNLNPLRDVLGSQVDFAALREHCPIRLYLCATNIETSRIRIFPPEELSIDAVLASACVPTLFQAVSIDGQHYWDGGYVGNPAIFPLIYHCQTHDVVIVHINPIVRHGVPTTAADILNRVNEVSFNSSLMREMRAIAFVTSLIQQGKLDGTEMKEVWIHSIRSDQTMAALGVSTKYNADWNFLCSLRDKGRAEASRWLEQHYDSVGRRSSIDISGEFL